MERILDDSGNFVSLNTPTQLDPYEKDKLILEETLKQVRASLKLVTEDFKALRLEYKHVTGEYNRLLEAYNKLKEENSGKKKR